jgi:hypothetical protein
MQVSLYHVLSWTGNGLLVCAATIALHSGGYTLIDMMLMVCMSVGWRDIWSLCSYMQIALITYSSVSHHTKTSYAMHCLGVPMHTPSQE